MQIYVAKMGYLICMEICRFRPAIVYMVFLLTSITIILDFEYMCLKECNKTQQL